MPESADPGRTPVPFRAVTLTDPFWAPRQRTVRDVTIPWVTRSHDPAGGIEAYRRDPDGYVPAVRVDDMEHIKFIESMATVHGLEPDPELAGFIEAWLRPVLEGQGADGYLGESWPVSLARPAERWSASRASHEDYAIGHFIEAAIGVLESLGTREGYEAAIRAADNMVDELLDSPRSYVSGTPEIEQALMRLAAISGDSRYVRLCGWLLDRRGRRDGRESHGRRCQDHLPLREQRTIEGHAVRAAYLFTGAAEYVRATGDPELAATVLAVWDDLADNKLYLHGGAGCQSAHNEGYRREPRRIAPDDVYGESCSAVGNVRWAHAMFRLTGEARFLDVAERILYNGFAAALSLDGDASFYCNVAQTGIPVASTDEELRISRLGPVTRSPEMAVGCCPPNIVTLIAGVGGHFYATDDRGIFVKHYGRSTAEIPWGDGVRLSQETEYPWDGDIRIRVEVASPTGFVLRLRHPEWAVGAELRVGDATHPVVVRDGWIEVDRVWRDGDEVTLRLPMPVRRTTMPDGFPGYENRVAVERGPIVYCLEAQDVRGAGEVAQAIVDSSSDAGDYLLAGICLPADTVCDVVPGWELSPGAVRIRARGRRVIPAGSEPVDVTLIPYALWSNRGPSAMRIWLLDEPVPWFETIPLRGWTRPGADD